MLSLFNARVVPPHSFEVSSAVGSACSLKFRFLVFLSRLNPTPRNQCSRISEFSRVRELQLVPGEMCTHPSSAIPTALCWQC